VWDLNGMIKGEEAGEEEGEGSVLSLGSLDCSMELVLY